MPEPVPLDTVTVADFEPYVDSCFALTLLDGQALRLTLQAATPLTRPGRTSAGRRPFSLLFTGPAAVKLPQQIYPLYHDALGLLEIFIVPISDDPELRTYEAIFS